MFLADSRAAQSFDICIMILIVFRFRSFPFNLFPASHPSLYLVFVRSVVMSLLESFASLRSHFEVEFFTIEWIFTAIFTVSLLSLLAF
jgi:branched-subunit amino acid transport protein AzlD